MSQFKPISEWQPIETAPKGKTRPGRSSVCWLMLAWPDSDEEGGFLTGSGMRINDKFYASATFYTGGPLDGKQYTLKELEVQPTHWMPLPEAPIAPPAQKRVSDEELVDEYVRSCRTAGASSKEAHTYVAKRDRLRTQILQRMKGPTRGEVERKLGDVLEVHKRLVKSWTMARSYEFETSRTTFLSMFPEGE